VVFTKTETIRIIGPKLQRHH